LRLLLQARSGTSEVDFRTTLDCKSAAT